MNVEPVLRVLESLGAHCALIGAHAMAARGYPRFTVDVDILTTDRRVLDRATWTELERDGATIECCRGDDDDPLAGVVHILLVDESDIDIVVGRWPWEADIIVRAEPLHVGGVVMGVPGVGDLILLKLAAGGYGDLQDAAALLALGPREALVHHVESHLGDIRPNVDALWRDLKKAPATD